MLFFELLQVAIGNRQRLSYTPSAEEWNDLYALARKQTMVGIAFRGVELLPKEQRPDKALLRRWGMATERIKAKNVELNSKTLVVANKFLCDGFPGIVLKGQGIAKLYNDNDNDNVDENDNENSKSSSLKVCANRMQNQASLNYAEVQPKLNNVVVTAHSPYTLNSKQEPLSHYRTSGDIDIWLKGERKEVIDYVRRHVPNCKAVYHHVDFPVVKGLDIEVHFTPTWMNSPITNRRLQWFFDECAEHSVLNVNDDDDENDNDKLTAHRYTEIPSPSLVFNRVYILVHIYRHLFAEGIGLRQLLDYYYVLRQGFTEEERDETMATLRSLKMQRFAGAVMWVLQHVFAMDDRYLLTAPDEREGQFLLGEIMLAGNFGKYDERLQHEQGESALRWGWRKVKRNFRFVRSYPSEVLWSPLFKIWHYFWRKGQ